MCWDARLPSPRVGDFDTGHVREFFAAQTRACGMTLNVRLLQADNTHHAIEATFKSFGRALKQAVAIDDSLCGGVCSSKGVIDRGERE